MTLEQGFLPSTVEPHILEKWLETGAFRAGANKKREETFALMIPPPNVTGILHMGHAFNNTLMDILVRWHRMRGFDTLWQPGQDHAGIATQMVVERELAQNGEPTRRDLGRAQFLEKVWAWKEKSGSTIIEQLKRLGASCDWERNRFTMDEGFHRAVLTVFVDFYNKGLIYRGKRLVNWDPKFETAISDLEVENIEVDGHMWHIKYPLVGGRTYTHIERDLDGNITLEEERDYISIATTRPETMLGDGAIAVHPDDARYAPIIGALCEIPIGPKDARRHIPILTDLYPDPTFGSGAVKITGAHDFNDHAVAVRHKIPMYRLLDTRAHLRTDGLDYATSFEKMQTISKGQAYTPEFVDTLNPVPEIYRGLDRLEARARIIKDVEDTGLMIQVENKKIMQPFGDRSKVVVEPMLTDQWFVDTAKIVEPAIDAVRQGETVILPKSQEKVYFHWLENIEPWCISRQLWWGHQIPVWYDADGREYCATTEEEAQNLAGDKTLRRDPDVLDTWFSSGLWIFGTLGWPDQTPELARYYPSQTLVTGFDILFFWVARMMMMSLAQMGKTPIQTVYLHALVRDERGRKMSKSLGNVLDPIALIDQFGADAVRFTLASMAGMGRDLKLSAPRFEGYRNFTTKIWQAARFAQMNKAKFGQEPDPTSIHAQVNKWILDALAHAQNEVDHALSEYRFNDAANALYAFVWGKFCDWYIEFSKPIFNGDDTALQDETRAVMGYVFDQILTLLHPFMPFVTEELWDKLAPRKNMLVHQDWPEFKSYTDTKAGSEIGWVITLIERIRSARAELRVPAGALLDLHQIELDEKEAAYFERNRPMILRLARIATVKTRPHPEKGAISVPVEGGLFALPLLGIIDFGKEMERLDKIIAKLSTEITALDGRLSNARFVESAPQDVVAEARERHTQAGAELDKLYVAQARIADILKG